MYKKIFILYAMSIIVTGCNIPFIHNSFSSGEITISQPQVFTSERLLAQRQDEIQVLKAEFENSKSISSSFQGNMSYARNSSLSSGLVVAFNPLNIASAKLQQNVTEMQSQIIQDSLRRVKDKAENGEISPVEAITFANSSTVTKALKNAVATAAFEKYSTPKIGLNPISTLDKANLTDVEKFNDRKAVRDVIRNAMNEQELDDTFDQRGNTMYVARFNVTINPQKGNNLYGMIDIQIESPEADDELYVSWASDLEHAINKEIFDITQKVDNGTLTTDDVINLVENTNDKDLSISTLQIYMVKSNATYSELKSKLADNIQRKYKHAVGDFVNISNVDTKPHDSKYYYIVKVNTNETGKQAFKKKLSEARPYVINIDPKNYNQNISQYLEDTKSVANLLSLGASIPNAGVDAKAYVEFVKKSQSNVNAILRKPLLVGFIDGAKRFGWLIGPRFYINDDYNPTFSHEAVSYSVQATVAVPGWWPSLNLVPQSKWLMDKEYPFSTGNIVKAINYRILDKTGVEANNQPTKVSAVLRPDFNKITLALSSYRLKNSMKPEIDESIKNDAKKKAIYTAKTGSKLEVLLFGKNLWKNPEVYVGSQKANTIHLLPDMKGIQATFDIISPRQSKKTDDGMREDIVITSSEGSDRVVGAVNILPSDTPEAKKKK